MGGFAAAASDHRAQRHAIACTKPRWSTFGGWDMPVEYAGLIAEHMAVRTAVGGCSTCRTMGDIQLRGPGSLAAVQKLLMNDASKLQVGQRTTRPCCMRMGTFVDDVVLHKLGENDYLIVINAGTREKDVQWVRKTIGSMPSVHINDFSDYYTQLAIQGPKAEATLQKLTSTDLSVIKNYWFTWGQGVWMPQRDDRADRVYGRGWIRDLHSER